MPSSAARTSSGAGLSSECTLSSGIALPLPSTPGTFVLRCEHPHVSEVFNGSQRKSPTRYMQPYQKQTERYNLQYTEGECSPWLPNAAASPHDSPIIDQSIHFCG